MRYIYGPVKSRRLGLSLGVSLTPYKICDFDCIYCQLGSTKETTVQRKEYVKEQDILNELKSWLQNYPAESAKLDYITFSGAGEPTLNIKIGSIIKNIKGMVNTPVAVITNASLLADAGVRASIEAADLIVPSLDAVTPEAFLAVDRPQAGIKLQGIIDGLIALRKEFRGKIWLEVMLVKGLNDDAKDIDKLREVTDRIKPDKIQLNSPVRASAEENIQAVDKDKLKKFQEILGGRCEIL